MTGLEVTNLLRKLGHTQKTAANVMGVQPDTVARWMHADCIPRRAELQLARLRKTGPHEPDYDLAYLLPLVQRLMTMEETP